MTNLKSKKTGEPILGCKEYCIKDVQGYKIGFVALAEKEWLG